ncbi:MAG: hypothetical protein DKM50_08295 [Candidatus Margulisiibacteriota bacterium]|nr:MAG: hypothetical protein A2X43_03075 [Candidatus Margulisbacteria bacterium GWD2_39_127]OGI04995.1 MAG: hypothetical protein A2X42_05340 [Candidatus Margulisbacteria bacterium GWF2_38_17]OGI08991.1 MAG: hypothetical protein A2X41_01535 [Candidatus Margulisbacteria bacterium GWE2_39_32]PZM79595.1 MAG: hypothetical protein DKM50_08295 [Candidatus Margulisiibacteriota bacterium]HAR63223.1 hypothetical protein [Candidatus Margulisiibacteriota bacterium]
MLNYIKGLRIKDQLLLTIGIFSLAFLVFGIYSYTTLNKVKVNGPIYTNIVLGKDLIADILPPPEYIIEAYLVVLEMLNNNDEEELKILLEKSKQLKIDYDVRHEYWINKDRYSFWTNPFAPKEMKDDMVLHAYDPAIEFFSIRDSKFIPAILEGNKDRASELAMGILKKKYQEHRGYVDKVVAAATDMNSKLEKDTTGIISQRTFLLITIAVAGFLVTIIFALIIISSLSAPINTIVEALKKISRGELDVILDGKNNNEVGQINTSINTMVGDLKNLIKNVKELALTITEKFQDLSTMHRESATGVEQITLAITSVAESAGRQVTDLSYVKADLGEKMGIINKVAQGADKQVADISKAVKNINENNEAISGLYNEAKKESDEIKNAKMITEQMARAIEQVSIEANNVSQNSEKTARIAANGETIVINAVNSINNIKETVMNTADKINLLGESSTQIGEIVEVINDIAGQTNLLALNAAIEAARAGEQGRGFAVVADEVRKLAERSTKATKEIAAIIKNIQSITVETVKSMETGTLEVKKGSELASQAREELTKIIHAVTDTVQQIQSISAAAEEINASSGETVNSINNIAQTVEKTLVSVTKAVGNTESMVNSFNEIKKVADNNKELSNAMRSGHENSIKKVDNVVNLAEDNSSTAEEVNASSEEITAVTLGINEMIANIRNLAINLTDNVSQFKL